MFHSIVGAGGGEENMKNMMGKSCSDERDLEECIRLPSLFSYY